MHRRSPKSLCGGLTAAVSQHLKDLEMKGVTIIPDVFSDKQLDALRKDHDKIADIVADLTQNHQPKKRVYEEDGKEVRSNYWVHEPSGRYVLECGVGRHDTDIYFDRGEALRASYFHSNPCVVDIVNRAMKGPKVARPGLVFSSSGSSDQYWHRDVDKLFENDPDRVKLVSEMSDFYFTCLIPLIDLTNANGTTEFMLGTHRRPASSYASAKCAQFNVKCGSAVLFNGKINHRGKGNPSKSDRPVLYVVYSKPWYNDYYRAGVPESTEKLHLVKGLD
uniref:Phytanoyl-CoA dioxygenase family protein n=1 Tax=Trieres chinensis TaxID=1514140 RepID=A0A7S1ZI27_TRICV|mmetsp:Transcript_26094/g.53420  ORF Transcript_26094/g.53420 Transcript_26094/m.53420 type:complete len:277 (+) Transcript_26094:41-871(+)